MDTNATHAPVVRENLAELAKLLAATKDAGLVEDFLYSLFTPSEADDFAKRWALVKELAEGVPQRTIAAELGLSLCKITRGSRELKKVDGPFRRMLALAGVALSDKVAKRT
jgi:TrpR family transcriptional regulator, trp operon repressor